MTNIIMIIIGVSGFIYFFIPDDIFLKVITLVLTTGIIISFLPNNIYMKVITLVVTACGVTAVGLFKVIKENKKLKKDSYDNKQEKGYNKLDSNLLKEIKEILYESYTIQFMRKHDFAGAFKQDFSVPLMNYVNKNDNDPEFYFLDSDLNNLKKDLDINIAELLNTLVYNTFDLEGNRDFKQVPREWREEQPERFEEVVTKANHHATKIVEIYIELIQLARKKSIDF